MIETLASYARRPICKILESHKLTYYVSSLGCVLYLAEILHCCACISHRDGPVCVCVGGGGEGGVRERERERERDRGKGGERKRERERESVKD